MHGIIETMNAARIEKIGDDLQKYPRGSRLTILKQGYIGTGRLFITLDHVGVGKYAQYEKALFMIFKIKGGREFKQLVFTPADAFAIFAGWIDRTETKKAPGFFGLDKKSFYEDIDGTRGAKIAEYTERGVENVAAELPRVYNVVTENGLTVYDDVAGLLNAYDKRGEMHDTIHRAELQGAPILCGLCGPMYDGERDGRVVIRYETRQAYELYSN